jgi:hypothetical protein
VHRITIYISNQLYVTFSKFFTSFLQLYMFRTFLAHLLELVCCIGCRWLDKWMCACVVWSPVVSLRKFSRSRRKTSQYNPEFTVWTIGTSASRYHNCCIDGETSPQCFGCNFVMWPIVIYTANPRITRLIRSEKPSLNTKTRKVNNW